MTLDSQEDEDKVYGREGFAVAEVQASPERGVQSSLGSRAQRDLMYDYFGHLCVYDGKPPFVVCPAEDPFDLVMILVAGTPRFLKRVKNLLPRGADGVVSVDPEDARDLAARKVALVFGEAWKEAPSVRDGRMKLSVLRAESAGVDLPSSVDEYFKDSFSASKVGSVPSFENVRYDLASSEGQEGQKTMLDEVREQNAKAQAKAQLNSLDKKKAGSFSSALSGLAGSGISVSAASSGGLKKAPKAPKEKPSTPQTDSDEKMHSDQMPTSDSAVQTDFSNANYSEREQLARDLGEVIVKNGVDVPRGGFDGKFEGRNDSEYYRVGFSYPTTLDGEVNVYNTGFVLLWWKATWNGPIEGEHKWVFSGSKDVKDFFKLAFVDLEFEKAMCIPTKDQKSEGETRQTLEEKRKKGKHTAQKSQYHDEYGALSPAQREEGLEPKGRTGGLPEPKTE